MHAALLSAALLAATLGGPLVARGEAYSVWDEGPLGLGHLVQGAEALTLRGRAASVVHAVLPADPGWGVLVVEPLRAFTDAEVAALRARAAAGDRVLLLGSGAPLADLVQRLGLGLAMGGGVYSPAYHRDAAFPVVQGLGGDWVMTLPRVVRGGQPVLATGLAWEDLDGDVAPDLGEAVGSHPVAALAALGAGQVLVVGSASPLTRDGWALGPGGALLDWLAAGSPRGILVDEAHRAPLDPLGLGAVLAGSPWGWFAPLALGAGALVWALQPRVHRKDEAAGPPGGARMLVAGAAAEEEVSG